MLETRNELTVLKANLVGGMNELVKSMNDESAYYDYWIEVVPDEADEEDLMQIAENEELFLMTTTLFAKLVKHFGDDLITEEDCKIIKKG